MKLARNLACVVLTFGIVACAQLTGVDGYENVDCVGERCDA